MYYHYPLPKFLDILSSSVDVFPSEIIQSFLNFHCNYCQLLILNKTCSLVNSFISQILNLVLSRCHAGHCFYFNGSVLLLCGDNTNNLYTYPLMDSTLFMKNGIKFHFKSLGAAFLKQVLDARDIV